MPSDAGLAREDRRRTNAAATRELVRRSARQVFAELGYAAARVEHIADATGVSPATIYSTVGGKSGLLTYWIDQWSADNAFVADVKAITAASTIEAVVDAAVASVRNGRHRWDDVITFARTAAATDAHAAELFGQGAARYRAAVDAVAVRVAADSAASPGVPNRDRVIADVLWFFLGFRGFDVLVNENGWSEDEASRWLRTMILAALDTPASRVIA